ncbi:glutamate carboxypeptidase [Mucor ambiguus]|uniref:Glutamate carboxypeptidase n=1 Tax=Mucor ambiguus TaxID=91626 RepID=A0A0C9LU31_9FUNG|nr:glutamate carboxypeptidase [Mucor ambiguus]
MKKGYLSVAPYTTEKPQYFDEKHPHYTTPLMVNALVQVKPLHAVPITETKGKEHSSKSRASIKNKGDKAVGYAGLLYSVHSVTFYHIALPPETAADLMKSIPSSDHIRHHFTTYASKVHLAGSEQDESLAKWTRQQWINYGLYDTHIKTYYPLLNYPEERRLAIVKGPEELLFEASLKESNETKQPSFHAYSGNGNVTASLVYVNYGRINDFQFLIARGVKVNGTIALIRNGKIARGLKVKIAEDMGCAGVVLYSDPEDDGPINDGAQFGNSNISSSIMNKPYPEGPWRSGTSVEQGSVQYTSYSVGDPSTPGYAATENVTRVPYSEAKGVPKIPSLPISWRDALPLLKSTEGFGIQADITWLGGICNISYFSGPSEAQINLVNINQYQVKPIWNVISKIKGTGEPDRAIILGNHRDAWGYGAVDPSSGSAVLMELVRTLGVLLERGWRPKRTIIIASWDAEEYGAVGSTEWVEDHESWLQEEAVAYLNVDYAVSGKHFSAQASPLLNRLLYQVADQVIDPLTSRSVYQVWKQERSRSPQEQDIYFEPSPHDNVTPLPLTDPLGVDSDHVAFFHHSGIASVSMGFRGEAYGVHHSIFDDIHWMEAFGDPTFEYHQTLTKIWGLLVLRLSSDLILPMYPQDYSTEIVRYIGRLGAKQGCLSFPFISSALHSLAATSLHFDKRVSHWNKQLSVKKHISKKLKKNIAKSNERILQFERAFLDPEGVSVDRNWFKHVIYGPDLNTGLTKEFPGLAQAIENDDTVHTKWVEERIGKLLLNAERTLRGHFDGDDYTEDQDDDEHE